MNPGLYEYVSEQVTALLQHYMQSRHEDIRGSKKLTGRTAPSGVTHKFFFTLMRQFLNAFANLRKAAISSVMSIRLHRHNSAPTVWILMKFDV
jgi:hypothetical protein